MIYLDLFLGFLYGGCFSFGGAYAAIPLIRDVVLQYGWINDDTLSYMIAISESTPGPIMVNLATYIGTNQAGFLGAFIATLAVVFPAFLIVIFIMVLLQNSLENKYIQAILGGMKPSIIGVIIGIGLYMILQNCNLNKDYNNIDIRSVVMTIILSIIYYGSRKVLKKGLTPIKLIIISALTGIIAYSL
ncbi:MAG: chromate transporter [Candidatus Riflebacteria bacterium]|nr:chromate transporter [Candidatus Riflebacteria bacterium]